MFGAAARTPCRWSTEARNWDEGVYKAATMGSETTAAATGAVGEVRRDPFAMLPFCGYHIGDYFQHGSHMGRADRASAAHLQRQLVSQGRPRQASCGRDSAQNMRVLKWIVERCGGTADAAETPLGFVPRYDDLDWKGIEFDVRRFSTIMDVDPAQWERELDSHDEFFGRLGSKAASGADEAAGSACGPNGGVIQLYI